MKRINLLFWFSGLIFWASVSIAAATPIHDFGWDERFPSAFSGFDPGNIYLFGRQVSGSSAAFFRQPENTGSDYERVIATFKNEKRAWEIKVQNQHENMADDLQVSNPVPSTLFLLGTGLIGIAAFRRKRADRRNNTRLPDSKEQHPRILTRQNLSLILEDHGKPSIQHSRV